MKTKKNTSGVVIKNLSDKGHGDLSAQIHEGDAILRFPLPDQPRAFEYGVKKDKTGIELFNGDHKTGFGKDTEFKSTFTVPAEEVLGEGELSTTMGEANISDYNIIFTVSAVMFEKLPSQVKGGTKATPSNVTPITEAAASKLTKAELVQLLQLQQKAMGQ